MAQRKLRLSLAPTIRPRVSKDVLRAEVSLVCLLAFTKSFVSLVSRVVGLFYTPQEKQTDYATDKPHERLRKC